MTPRPLLTSPRLLTPLLLLAALGLTSRAEARSIIKNPNNPYTYDVELEPHLLWATWDTPGWWDNDDAFGPGVRVNIPIVPNGPIKKINNSMAIGFGLDWAHSGDCGRYDDCSWDEYYVPVVLQWNFFLTDVISVFGEPGLTIRHWTWDDGGYYCGVDRSWCDNDASDTDLGPTLQLGGRFMFSDNVGAVVRLGYPYHSAGITFLL